MVSLVILNILLIVTIFFFLFINFVIFIFKFVLYGFDVVFFIENYSFNFLLIANYDLLYLKKLI